MGIESYDRRASGTPLNRLRECETFLRQAEREVERAEGTIRGLYAELAIVAKHTHDKAQRANYEYVMELKERTEQQLRELKKLAEAYDEAAREFR